MLLTSVPADGGARPQSQEVVIGNEGTRTRFRTTPHIMEAEHEGTERKARAWRALATVYGRALAIATLPLARNMYAC